MYTKKIYFSGGSCHELQEIFEGVPGVLKVTVGNISAINVRSYVNPEPQTLENLAGIEIEFNPKKMDISMLMDVLCTVLNPYSENNIGVYYVTSEDEPQVDLHMNFIANRGKQPAATSAMLTINDTTFNKKLSRKCYACAGRLKNFSPYEEDMQHYLKKHSEIKTDVDFTKLKAYLRF